ncbi:MAG: taurine dioxygenase, partial [Alphaproteobacteria bacterium]|nr:taurine dioxygenase [Alphaproteobacteria bacterium]
MSQPLRTGGVPSLDVRPLSGAIGAEIHGVDLSCELDDETVAAIRHAWLDHLVIFFRDQTLTPAQFLALAGRFGQPVEYPFVKGIEGFPEVTPVIKLAHETMNFGGVWHSDTAYLETPPQGTLLIAREVPPAGGDTLFSSQYRAYETLSEGMRRLLDGLIGVNESAKADATRTREDGKDGTVKKRFVAEHPVVRTHPETGRRALYVNIGHTTRFAGMTEAESAPLLGFLFQHQIRPEFTCRFSWRPGSIAFWDNRCAQHYPINDYHGY